MKNEWTFLNDISQFGIDNNSKQQITTTASTTHDKNHVYGRNSSDYSVDNNKAKKVDNDEGEDPVKTIKMRLAKGEISKEEYEELRRAIAS
jgi:Short C-terminal domain